MNKFQLLVSVITFEMKAPVAIANALASSSAAPGKYSLYCSYNHGLLNLIRPDSRSKQPKNRRQLFLRGSAIFGYFFYY